MLNRFRASAADEGTAADDWRARMEDFVDTVGAGLDVVLVPRLLDLKLLYNVSMATRIRDFATDIMEPYMQAVDNNANRSIFLGATQPNYEAHIATVALHWKLE
jgi:hypothetical protein